jgi:hypothetical protein
METKPGYQTSESWLSACGGVAIVQIASASADPRVHMVACAALAVLGGVYAWMRTKAKA